MQPVLIRLLHPELRDSMASASPPPSQPQPSSSTSSTTDSTGTGSGTQTQGETGTQDSTFECNICLDTSKDAVISLCGHLFWYMYIH